MNQRMRVSLLYVKGTLPGSKSFRQVPNRSTHHFDLFVLPHVLSLTGFSEQSIAVF
jgi:hypothetical protein